MPTCCHEASPLASGGVALICIWLSDRLADSRASASLVRGGWSWIGARPAGRAGLRVWLLRPGSGADAAHSSQRAPAVLTISLDSCDVASAVDGAATAPHTG